MDSQDGLPRLVQLYPADSYKGDTTIDIIAVHGIETHSPKTWIAYERDEEPKGRGTYWLRDKDMLPKAMPQARIWTYDYNSNCYSDNAQHVDILGLGETFLEMLWGAKDMGVGRRSLIFIGSCFGGVVVAQALERASRDQMKYEYLLRSTIGVVFLGTPLRGTTTASIADWVALIRGFMGKETSRALLQSLKENASSLDTLIHDFSKMAIAHNLQITCFYETRTTQIVNAVSRGIAKWFSEIKLVPKESACLDGHKRIPLEVRHAMMNKFRDPEDVNFTLVSGNLKDIADNAYISQRQTTGDLECLRCLTSNYREGKDRNEQRVPETGEWFLEHPKFLRWRENESGNLLWVSADPGCGKSVLSRALVDEGLLSLDIRKVSVCYFFFKDDDPSRQSGAEALSAILHQLLIQKPTLLQHAKSSFENNGEMLRAMFNELWDILMKCATDPQAGEIVCVLDALDECKKPAREDLVTQLSRFYSAQDKAKTHLKFLITSRPYYDIELSFNSSIDDISTIQLEGEYESEKISKEIDLVIDYQVPRISRMRKFPLKLEVQHALREHLKKVPNRTYLWLHLILDAIRKSLDSTAIRLERLIDRLPRTVEDAYEKILTKINDSELAEQARRILHIIVAAARPLTLREINIALAIDENLESGNSCKSHDDLDLESAKSIQHKVRNLCGLFVSIIDSRLYLIHQTAKEFLISENVVCMTMNSVKSSPDVWRHSLNLVESNLILTKICLSYLLFRELNYSIAAEDTRFEMALSHGFLDYAASHWVTHYRQAGIEEDSSMLRSTLDVCDTKSNRFWRWIQWDWQIFLYTAGPSTIASELTIAAYFGLETVVKLLLKKANFEIGCKDHFSLAALSMTASEAHARVVKLLLERTDAEINLKDNDVELALSFAARYGHAEVVKMLLKQNNVEISFKDNRGDTTFSLTAISLAASAGHVEVVKLLLEQTGVELSFQDKDSLKAFIVAAMGTWGAF